MAYETKVILTLLADRIAVCENLEEAYEAVRNAANAEVLELPAFAEKRKPKKGSEKK